MRDVSNMNSARDRRCALRFFYRKVIILEGHSRVCVRENNSPRKNKWMANWIPLSHDDAHGCGTSNVFFCAAKEQQERKDAFTVGSILELNQPFPWYFLPSCRYCCCYRWIRVTPRNLRPTSRKRPWLYTRQRRLYTRRPPQTDLATARPRTPTN